MPGVLIFSEAQAQITCCHANCYQSTALQQTALLTWQFVCHSNLADAGSTGCFPSEKLPVTRQEPGASTDDEPLPPRPRTYFSSRQITSAYKSGALYSSRLLTLTQLIFHGHCIWRFWQVRSLR